MTAPSFVHRPSDALSAKSRKTFGKERYARRRLPGEAPPRTFVPTKWEPLHPDLVAVVVRPGALDALQIKSRGM